MDEVDIVKALIHRTGEAEGAVSANELAEDAVFAVLELMRDTEHAGLKAAVLGTIAQAYAPEA